MKTRCKKLMLIRTAVKRDEIKNNAAIENIQPVCPDLPGKKRPQVTVANSKLNTPKDQPGRSFPTGFVAALQKIQHFSDSLNKNQLTLAISIVTPKTGI
ncbi:MAG TPA: hypothetical protein VFW07_09995 [Parafilimonas sp.]|nr:hypothetical protein [Parafilimonas sp.]